MGRLTLAEKLFFNHKMYVGALLTAVLLTSSCATPHKTAFVNAGQRSVSSREAVVNGPKDRVRFERLFYDANKEKILGNYQQAVKLFLASLNEYPNCAAANYELAVLLEMAKDFQRALYYSKKAAYIDPDNIWYQLEYISCLKDVGKWNDVVSLYQKIIKKYPNEEDYYYELINAYLNLKKIDDVVKTYELLDKRFGPDKEITLQKIKLYQLINQLNKAIEITQKFIVDYPEDYTGYGILGDLYQSQGKSDEALQAYQKMLSIAPDDYKVHLTLANYYRNQKQDEKALEEISIAFKSRDMHIDEKIKILLSYYDISEKYPQIKPDAEKLCKILVEVNSDDAKSFAMYGDFLYRDKKMMEARTQYRKAIALDKEKYAIWSQLLFINAELDDNAALEKESKQAMELFPTQPFPYLFNGVANIHLKKYNEAIDALTQGKDYVIDNAGLKAQFYGYIGDAQNELKNYQASDAAYNKALELDARNTTILNNYAYYLSVRNENLQKAEAMSKKSNELEPGNNSYQDTYGWILYKMGKYEEALVWIGKAIENGGSANGTLLEHYGDVLYKMGKKEDALKYWEKAKQAGGAGDLIDKKVADKVLYE